MNLLLSLSFAPSLPLCFSPSRPGSGWTRWHVARFNNTTIVHRNTNFFSQIYTPWLTRAAIERVHLRPVAETPLPRYRVRHPRPHRLANGWFQREIATRSRLICTWCTWSTTRREICARFSPRRRDTSRNTTTGRHVERAEPLTNGSPPLLACGAERDSGYHPKVIPPPGPPCATAWACQPAYLPISASVLSPLPPAAIPYGHLKRLPGERRASASVSGIGRRSSVRILPRREKQ